MFKALNTTENTDVVIIDPRWQENIENLRILDRQDLLVCQGCREPVRVRAGQSRRHHFAHKHIQNCTYSDESADLLDARAVLYEWLFSKFGENVAVEKKIEGSGLFRPVDCWVEKDDKIFAYWIIDSSLSPEKRDAIHGTFNNRKYNITYVFISKILRKDSDKPSCIHLNTTEREFMQRSVYDEVADSGFAKGETLHYLDAQERKIVTFRGLHVVHRPQVYLGNEISNSLDKVLVSPKNGEFVHVGEHDQLKIYQEEKAEKERKQQETIQKQNAINHHFMDKSKQPNSQFPNNLQASTHDALSSHLLEKSGICIFCGINTTNWWTYDSKTGQCKCKRCLQLGKS